MATLRAILPASLDRIISSDRVSLNEIDLSSERRKIIPSPFPSWWPRLGELFRDHLHEHPLWNPRYGIKCNQVITFKNFAQDETWKSSVLYNDYYVNLEIRHQMGALIQHVGNGVVGVAINRARGNFKPRDKALLELLSAHIGNAYRTVTALESVRWHHGEHHDALSVDNQIIALKSDGQTISHHSPGAMELLRTFFLTDTGVEAGLPEEVQRWLSAQRESCLHGDLTNEPIHPLVIKRWPHRLIIRLVCHGPEETTLLLRCDRATANHAYTGKELLTRRELEIMRWVTEGKRNTEIAIILGVSFRTVEKHLEHIFSKLGVETRTAAARQVREYPNGRYA